MSSPFDRDVWAILGMPIDNVTLDQAAELVEQAVASRTRLSFVTPNVNWLVRALKDDVAMRQIVNADLSLADGAPVVWLARQLGMPLKQRVAGSDLFERLRQDRRAEALPIRVFFFGGREGSAEAAYKALQQEGGRMVAAGWCNPGFGDVESMSGDEIRAKINAANPDFLVVSLGAAKGQTWIERNQGDIDAPVIAHLGAVVDFVAGSIRRAPAWVSRLGLEWIWRILADPGLWRRYWSDGTNLIDAIRARLGVLKNASKTSGSANPMTSEQDGGTLRLSGDMVEPHRDGLRSAFRSAVETGGDCTLDIRKVSAIDAAALGQVRMLEQCLIRRGNRLQILSSHQTQPALEAANMTLQGVT